MKYVFILITSLLLGSSGAFYFSDENISERQLNAMLETGEMNIEILNSYLDSHDYETDWQYDKALNLAALISEKRLAQLTQYYADGSFQLTMKTANKIINSLPSDSVNMNLSAGRIFLTDEFGMRNLKKSVSHLEYAALRGNQNAAEYLALMYKDANCLSEAATWSKIANTRKTISECGQIIVDVNLLNSEEWDAVLYNVDAIRDSYKTGTIASLKHPGTCSLH